MKTNLKKKAAGGSTLSPLKKSRVRTAALAAKVKQLSYRSEDISDSIYKLFNNELMALEITGFSPREFCAELVAAIKKYPQDTTYLGGNATKVLESQHNTSNNPDKYFAGTSSHPLLKEPAMVAAVAQLQQLLRASEKPVSVAFEPKRKEYYSPGIIRRFEGSLKLHNDLGAREGKNWDPIQNVHHQWAFVLKLSTCTGGATRWFPRQWRQSDERYFNTEDGYSYNEAVVEGYPEFKFIGQEGTLILFNSTCFHAVEPVIAGERYTLGGFIGLLEESNELIIWS